MRNYMGPATARSRIPTRDWEATIEIRSPDGQVYSMECRAVEWSLTEGDACNEVELSAQLLNLSETRQQPASAEPEPPKTEIHYGEPDFLFARSLANGGS